MRITTTEEQRKIDNTAINNLGVPGQVLMENAGLEAARLICRICREQDYRGEILLFCGKGKNGGDGMVVARRLLGNGHKVRVFLMHDPSEYSDEAAVNLRVLQNMKAKVSIVDSASVVEEYFKSAVPPFVAVDAMVGTGLTRALEGAYYDVVELLNQRANEIIALDIPTGVLGDSGRIAATSIVASTTISFGFPKMGHFLAPGAARRGKLYNVNLTFPRQWMKEGDKFLLTPNNTASLLQKRDRFGHKNSFGHCLLIGGSPGRVGAVVMASASCLKMGTGLVTVASWDDSFPALDMKLSSEIMTFRIIRQGDEFLIPKPGLPNYSSIVVGPGLGTSDDGRLLMEQLVQGYNGPLVIDADGLNLIAEHKMHHFVAKRLAPTVITPHPGEMARLLGVTKDAVLDDPIAAVKEANEKTGAIVVLKGPTSLIYSSDGVTWLNHYPNDGMATAGSGDVLAGMIGGLVGQKMHPMEATKLGVYVHSQAGRFAAQVNGHRAMTALDIIKNIRLAFKKLREHKAERITSATIEVDPGVQ